MAPEEEERASSRPERPEGFYELRRIVAANIRTLRQDHGYSQKGLADRLAIYLGQMGAPAISSWESSREDGSKAFTVEELYALASVFHCTVVDLLAYPRLKDISPIERAPGEEPPITIPEIFGAGENSATYDSWQREIWTREHPQRDYGPDEAPF